MSTTAKVDPDPANPIVNKPLCPGKYETWGEHDKTHEDGKHRRYELLFAVNGGAFAISKFAIGEEKAKMFLNSLTLREVAVGMIIFTVLMWRDIFVLGSRLRVDAGDNMKWDRRNPTKGTFSPWGRIVLGAICILLILAWGRVIAS
jgi:hypothetical protein